LFRNAGDRRHVGKGFGAAPPNSTCVASQRPARRRAPQPRSRKTRGRNRRIVTIGSADAAVLFSRSRPVRAVNRDVRALVADLIVTMRRARGVGIAAPQIGVPARVLIAGTGSDMLALVNPRMRRRWGSQLGPEGCLSMPGVVADVRRAFGVEVDGRSVTGRQMRVRATGFLSRILQHEIDHLDGILFLDRLDRARGARVRDRERGPFRAGPRPPRRDAHGRPVRRPRRR